MPEPDATKFPPRLQQLGVRRATSKFARQMLSDGVDAEIVVAGLREAAADIEAYGEAADDIVAQALADAQGDHTDDDDGS